MPGSLLLLAALVSAGLGVRRYLARHPRRRCPHCGSRQVGQVAKEPTFVFCPQLISTKCA